MSGSYLKSSVYAFLCTICLFSCGATDRLTIRVAQPAPVYLSPEVQSIGIIDRSTPEEKSATIDKIEQVLSAETKDLDKKGATAATLALQAELLASGRFKEVKIISADEFRKNGMGLFPALIPWQKLQTIREKHQIDAVFSLAFYDTDRRIDYRLAARRISNPLGGNIPVPEHQASVNTLISNGWRVYDLTQQLLIDELVINESFVLRGRGINPMKAVQAVMGRDQAVEDISQRIGQEYALRTLPYYTRVGRNYYVRGTKKFKRAKRRAQTGNWNGAADLWREEVDHRKNKIGGRACYNMAIIKEINGDLDAAIEWASRSYADHNNKKALSYLRILEQRRLTNMQID